MGGWVGGWVGIDARELSGNRRRYCMYRQPGVSQLGAELHVYDLLSWTTGFLLHTKCSSCFKFCMHGSRIYLPYSHIFALLAYICLTPPAVLYVLSFDAGTSVNIVNL